MWDYGGVTSNSGISADPLSPEGVDFRHVSPALAKVRVTGAALSLLVPAVGLAVGGFFFAPLFIGTGVLVALFLWLLWLIPRQVRATLFATTNTDFLVRRGIMFRRLDIVPYGRIQYVDVKEGPIARKMGVAGIQLHTASASTDAELDGLPVEEAAALRDLLVANGTAELSGL